MVGVVKCPVFHFQKLGNYGSIRGRNVPDGRECAGLRPKVALPAGDRHDAECPRPDRPLPTCRGCR